MSGDRPFTPCRVTAYSGHRGDERPSSLVIGEREVRVLAMRTMRIEEDFRSRRRRRLFDVLTSDGRTYELCHDGESGAWSARSAP